MDAFVNFALSTLASGITSGATSLTVASGEGARFPAVPFNATIWNRSDSTDPSGDSGREIVRVTARSTDTLTVSRGQEGTSASAHNTSGKTYGIVAGLTARTLTELALSNVVTTQFNKTSNTTLADVAGLSLTLEAGGSYLVQIELFITRGSGGSKFKIAGTCGATSSMVDLIDYDLDNFVLTTARSTVGGLTFIGSGNLPGRVHATLVVAIVVSTAGTIVLQYAQDVSHSDTSSILIGSTMYARKL